jgi:hypothetical protein
MYAIICQLIAHFPFFYFAKFPICLPIVAIIANSCQLIAHYPITCQLLANYLHLIVLKKVMAIIGLDLQLLAINGQSIGN